MGRMGRVRAQKTKDIEKVLKLIIYPPAIAGALLLDAGKKKRRKK